MNTAELRIGNLVNIYQGNVKGFVTNCIVESIGGQINGYDEDDVEPLPLTEGWLKRLGFDQFGKYSIWNKQWRKEWMLSAQKHPSLKDGFVVFIEDNESAAPPSVPIMFVHQLQNLYFSLAGEELIIKE